MPLGVPTAQQEPLQSALDFTHTGSPAAQSPTGLTAGSYWGSAGDRKSHQVSSFSEAGLAALGDGHTERKSRLEPEGWFLFVQVPDSGEENQEREDKNKVSSPGDKQCSA